MASPIAMESTSIRRLPRWDIVLLILTIVGAWSGWDIYIDYDQWMEQEYRLLEVRAGQHEARISGSLRSIDLMLRSITGDLRERPARSVADQNRLLRSYMRQLPELRNMVLVDAAGSIRAEANETSIGKDASQREYFKHHLAMAGDDGFFVSRPFRAFSGVTVITLSRVMRDANGGFAGVAVAALDSGFFDEALKLSVPEAGVESFLITLEGDVVAMSPRTGLVGKNLRGGIAFTEHTQSGKTTTRHLNKDTLEPVVEMSVFHNLTNTPLAVMVSRDFDSLIAGWRHSFLTHLGGFLLLAGTAVLFSWLAARRQKELVQSQQALAEREFELRAIIETEPECVKQMAADGSLLSMNRAGLNMIEADSFEQVAGQKVQQLVTPEYQDAFDALNRRVFEGTPGSLIFEIIGLKGGRRWLETHAVPLRDSRQRITAVLGVTRDISDHKQLQAADREAKRQLESQLAEITQLQERLQHLVIRDPLTGLHNRRYLDEALPRELSRAKREGYSLAVVMIDLDHFKRVNDTYGHAAGDEVLRTLAATLKVGARESDIICRYGGEEFLIALPQMSLEHAMPRVEAWRLSLAGTTVMYGELAICVTLSAGIAGFPEHGGDAEKLISYADEALYQAKNAGRNRVTCCGTEKWHGTKQKTSDAVTHPVVE